MNEWADGEQTVVAFNKKHDTLPSTFYASRHKGREMMDTLQFGANLKLLMGYEVQCLKRLKKERLIT